MKYVRLQEVMDLLLSVKKALNALVRLLHPLSFVILTFAINEVCLLLEQCTRYLKLCCVTFSHTGAKASSGNGKSGGGMSIHLLYKTGARRLVTVYVPPGLARAKYDFQNNQPLFTYGAFTDWSSQWKTVVVFARCELYFYI